VDSIFFKKITDKIQKVIYNIEEVFYGSLKNLTQLTYRIPPLEI
jgi:hypothetical protein